MQLELTNFRCFAETSLRLTPLTVIVGPNASGKSALVQALDPGFQPSRFDIRQRRTRTAARVLRRWEGGKNGFEATERATHPVEREGRQDLRYQRLQLDVNDLRRVNTVAAASVLHPSGANFTNVFATLPRAVQGKLAAEFGRFIPVFADVDARPSENEGAHRLVFQDRWNADVWYEPSQVSDGSLLTLAFLLLQHQKPAVEVLVIEELERGLHPYLIGELVDLLRRMANGEIGSKPMHIVLTTHSASLLEFVRPEEVRLLNRKDDGSVEIAEVPTGTAEWKQAYEEYERSFGSLWLSGGLGGVP
jgi:predicted ATPase